MDVGSFSFPFPVFPAPMCGVMDAPFRAMLLKFGTPLLYTEMIASHATILEHRKQYIQKATLKETDQVPFVVQIAGCNPDIMGTATKIAIDLGANIVDINFGCPVKKIVNSYAGSAIMKDEKLATQIIKSVVKVAHDNNTPATVKMRMGWDEQHKNATTIAKIAESEGINAITVHCRTRSQMYSGKADWSFIEGIKNIVKIPVVVNGDIDIDNLKTALSVSNGDGAMIGRALYGKPWLIADCISLLKNDTIEHHKPTNLWEDCIAEHLERIFSFYPKTNAVGFAIKNLYFYSQNTNGGAKFRCELAKCKNKENIFHLAENFFSQTNV